MRNSWAVRDFWLIWLGGLFGGLVAGAVGLAIESPDWSIALTLAGSLGGNLVVLGILFRRRADPDLGFSLEFGDLAYLALGFGFQIAIAIVMSPLARALFPEGGALQEIPQELADPTSSVVARVAIVAALVFLGPVVEEMVYRGVLLRSLSHRGQWFTILTTAAVFAGVHIVTLTRPILASAAVVLPPLFILGGLLAWLTLHTGRLGPAIFTHTGFNTVTALVLFIPPEVLENLAG